MPGLAQEIHDDKEGIGAVALLSVYMGEANRR
jgi:hypothetical protein